MPTRRSQTLLHALAFVLGFSVMFILLGASVAFLGLLLNRAIVWMQRVGGVVIIVLGLSTLGLLKLPFLYTDRRIHVGAKPRLGYLSSLLMGVFFSAGWIPCVGPVLAAIYLLAGSTQTVGQGALLLATYSLGLGLPFMITGAALSTIGGWLQRVNRHPLSPASCSWLSAFCCSLTSSSCCPSCSLSDWAAAWASPRSPLGKVAPSRCRSLSWRGCCRSSHPASCR
jgi:cytochrome c biogenesis protein CcdA